MTVFSGFLNIPDVMQSILPECCSHPVITFAIDTIYLYIDTSILCIST